MREFFRGWRRKVGVMTLVMACAMMIASLRFIAEQESMFAEVRAKYPNHRVDLDWNTIPNGGFGVDVVFASPSYVPDLLIAVPLTLLSAWLLLSKPRKSKSASVQPPSSQS